MSDIEIAVKAPNVDNRKVEDFREDGRALFPGAQRWTTYGSPSDNKVYPIDRFGYARSVDRGSLEDPYDHGRHAPKSGLGGIHHLVDGKPHYTGKENQWSSSRFSSRRS
nr:MAG: hypothetical protein [Bacteriophage sp.]